MKSNDGFILLDALCAFMLLSSSIIFFNQMLYLNNINTQKINDQLSALNYLRENMYKEYKVTSTDEYQTYFKDDLYCASYKEAEACIYY